MEHFGIQENLIMTFQVPMYFGLVLISRVTNGLTWVGRMTSPRSYPENVAYARQTSDLIGTSDVESEKPETSDVTTPKVGQIVVR